MDNGGWTNFREVTKHVLPTHRLFRASSPNYLGADFTQHLTQASIDFLLANNINRIISLNQFPYTADEQASLSSAGITYLHLPVEDFHPPTTEQLARAFEFYNAQPEGASTLLFVTKGESPEESAWRAENFVEKAEQMEVLRRLRELIRKGEA